MPTLVDKYKIYGLKTFFAFLLTEAYRFFWWRLLHVSFSQKGEDVIADRLLHSKRKGFYVDVGAYQPDKFNNTKKFYLRGWRGINIEPDPDNFLKFKKHRQRDINLNIGIGRKSSYINFFKMFPDTLSTFSKKTAKVYRSKGFKLVSVKKVQVMKLSDVLKKNKTGIIDLMSIDTEGYDLEVLKSNDWKRFRPKVIILETGDRKAEKFLVSQSYRKVYANGLNSIFVAAAS